MRIRFRIDGISALEEMHLHSDNRLYKPWFWNVKVHCEGARGWHVGKEGKWPGCQATF